MQEIISKRFRYLMYIQILLILMLMSLGSDVYVVGGDAYRIVVNLGGYDGESALLTSLYDVNNNLLYNETLYGDVLNLTVLSPGTYYLAIVYKRVTYFQQINVSDSLVVVNITLYDVMESDTTVDIPVHHIIINPQGGYLQVMEVAFFRNTGDKVIINGTKLRMYLPREFMKFQSDIMSCCVEIKEWGFVFNLMANLFPGQAYRVTYNYEIPVSGDEYYFEVEIPYSTSYLLIAVKAGYEISNPRNLNYVGTIDVQQGSYSIYEAYNLTPGAKVGLTIKGVGASNLWVLSALVAVTSVSVVTLSLWSIFRKKPSLEELERQKEELLALMEELENRYKNGEIEDEEYLRLRIKYKKKVIKLLKRIDRMKSRGVEAHESTGEPDGDGDGGVE